MSKLIDEIIKGRKVFFIMPDKSLLPQSYLEEYMLQGYECYFVNSDIFLPIEIKLDIILSIFRDSILFFNIDAPLQNSSWTSIIKNLQEKYPEAFFGVMYNKRQNPQERQKIEQKFLYNMELKCGCIQLEYQKKNNFELISKVLYATQAMGRRKNVRAVCSGNCIIQITLQNHEVLQFRLSDISISHFSFLVTSENLRLKPSEKIEDIAFMIHGLRFRSDGIFFMTREVDSGILYIFAFETKDGRGGLDENNRNNLVPKLYEIMEENCSMLLDKLFATAAQKRANPGEAAEKPAEDSTPAESK